jgi:hypothetical protein
MHSMEKNEEFLNVEECCIHSNHCALKQKAFT